MNTKPTSNSATSNNPNKKPAVRQQVTNLESLGAKSAEAAGYEFNEDKGCITKRPDGSVEREVNLGYITLEKNSRAAIRELQVAEYDFAKPKG